jgi:Fic family protein
LFQLLHQALQKQPVTTAAALSAATGLTPATVNKTLLHLERASVVAEITDRRRGRVFAYRRCVDLINAGLDGASASGG